MVYKFRTDGPWGAGSLEDLEPEDVDNNFWTAIQEIAAKAAQGVGISNFVQSGNQFTVVLTDHTLLGPYTLPMATLQFKGEWLPNNPYLAGDIITQGGSTYIVLLNHTSEATFDPGANNGSGGDFYGLLLENPTITIPSGGAIGAFLRKLSIVDYASYWGDAALTDLVDVSLPDSPGPVDGDLLTFSGGLWVAQSQAVLGFLLSQLGDVEILESPEPTEGQLLTYNGTLWTNVDPAFNPTIITPTAGQIMTYEGGIWKNSSTANIPVKAAVSVFGPLTIDYSEGSVQRVVMTNGVVLNPITNWPPSGQFGRLVLEVRNTGAFTWEWPAAYKWPAGANPIVSTAGRDIFALTTFDGGTNVDGSVIGQNYM